MNATYSYGLLGIACSMSDAKVGARRKVKPDCLVALRLRQIRPSR